MFGPQQPADDRHSYEPQVPPIRTFRVLRDDPRGGGLEELVIDAHEVSYNASNVLIFTVYRIEDGIPGSYIVRAFNGWIDYAEVHTSPLARGIIN